MAVSVAEVCETVTASIVGSGSTVAPFVEVAFDIESLEPRIESPTLWIPLSVKSRNFVANFTAKAGKDYFKFL